MYDRAPRDVIFKVGSTPEAVGPGAYETDKKLLFKGDGYAPFLSMSCRETHPNAVDQVTNAAPGPGYYDVQIQDRPKGKGPLANKSKRFSDTVSETPGPGAYHSQKYKELGHKPKSAPGMTGEDGAMLTSNRIKFYRKPEAPSIPSHGQAYGYEECDDGTLKRQDPPGRDTSLGPAFYTPVVPESKSTKTYKGIHFGKLSSSRWNLVGKPGPGPGQYNPYEDHSTKAENAHIVEEDVLRQQPRLPRYHELIEIQEKKRNIPGPGAYELRSSFLKQEPCLNTEGIEVDHPPFLFQTKRFASMKSIVPAPGTYNDPRTALAVLNRVTGLKKSPFSQTAVRFIREQAISTTPGPGAYTIPGLGAESMRKAYMEATRKGVFGTTAPRTQPVASAPELDKPGPGHYQIVEKVFQPRSVNLDSNFASVTRRLKVPDNGVPPPGTYDTVAAFEKCQGKCNTSKPRSVAAARKHGSFMSAAPRFNANKDSEGPGPSSYNVAMESLSKKGGVISGPGLRLHEKEDIPGPGTYTLSPLLQDTVLKGTFNHTLGNPVLASTSPTQIQTNTSHAFLLGV